MNGPDIWGSRQWLRLTKEAVRGVYSANPSDSDVLWARLDRDNAFTMEMAPNPYSIRSADAKNQAVQSDFHNYATQGALNTLFYPSQSSFFLQWMLDLTATGTPPVYSSRTVTVDWRDGARVRRFLGVHVQEGQLNALAGQPARWSFRLIGWKEDVAATVEMTEPAFTSFPSDPPFHLGHSAGALKIGSDAARTQYERFAAVWTNRLAVDYCESPYPDINYAGRDVKFACKLKYKAGQTDRSAFQWQTTQAVANEITFSRAGSPAVKLDFRSKVKLASYQTAHPLDGIAYAQLEGSALYDHATPAGVFQYTIIDP